MHSAYTEETTTINRKPRDTGFWMLTSLFKGEAELATWDRRGYDAQQRPVPKFYLAMQRLHS